MEELQEVQTPRGPTYELAAFLSRVDYEDLPAPARLQAKRILLDFLGVALAGAIMENSRILMATVMQWGGRPVATVIGYPDLLPAPLAGLLNGAFGHAVQMDDTEWTTVALLGTEIIPAILAVAEQERQVGGKEIIRAMVLGYEGAIRIGAAVNPSHHLRGFSPNGTLGVFGAAIAAGCVLGLDEDRMADAIGSAAMQSSGLEEFCYDGSMSAILNTAHATFAGIIAAQLAKNGFTGSRTILEGKSGFCRAYADTYELSRLTDGLGEHYGIVDVWFKRYPTCAYINAALDLTLDLAREHAISAEDVQEIVVKTFSIVKETVDNTNPENETAAMLSMPYALAVALLAGQVTLDQFTKGWLYDPRVRELMQRVKIVVAEEELLRAGLKKDRGAQVQIRCKDGRQHQAAVIAPKGDPLHPLTDAELQQKFEQLACKVVDHATAAKIVRTVEELESLEDVATLTKLLQVA